MLVDVPLPTVKSMGELQGVMKVRNVVSLLLLSMQSTNTPTLYWVSSDNPKMV